MSETPLPLPTGSEWSFEALELYDHEI